MANHIENLTNLLGWSPLIQSLLMFLTACVSAWAVYLSIRYRNEDRQSAVNAVEAATDQAKKKQLLICLSHKKQIRITFEMQKLFATRRVRRSVFPLSLTEAISGFVYELRQQTGIRTLYQDLEQLVDNWRKNPIQSIRN